MNDDQLNAVRIEEISRILTHFQDVQIPVTDELLAEYCKLNKFEPLILAEYNDYKFQKEQDAINKAFFADMLSALGKLTYVPTFISAIERKKLDENNEQVRVSIAMLIEDHSFLHRLITPTINNMASLVGQAIESAGTTAWNKGREVLNVLAMEKFGKELDMGTAKQFVIDFFEKKTNTKFTDSK